MSRLLTQSMLSLEINRYQEKSDTDTKKAVKKDDISKYSSQYRVQKTVFLIIARISMGVIVDMISSTYEDLRILLDLNYDGISKVLVIRGLGMLIMMFFSGVIFDKFSRHAELIMAIGGLFVSLRKYNFYF